MKSRFTNILNTASYPGFWLWFTPLLLIAPNIGLGITEINSGWARATNIILPLGIYMWLFSLSIKTGRTILFSFPIMFFGAFEIVLLFLYGQSIIAIDMYVNILTTSVTEATELLGNLMTAIIVVVAMYIPPIIAAIVMCCNRLYAIPTQLSALRRTSYVILAAGVVLFVCSLIIPDSFNARRELFPYNVMENMITAIRRAAESAHYHQTSDTFSYSPVMTRSKNEPEVFVVVIGETSRADNWQLYGYNRPTNPRLSERSNLYKFSHVLSEINTTHKAVPMLLSYLTPENFGDSVAHTRSIFSAFNDLGYRTAFISNQRRNHSYIDFFGQEAQQTKFISDAGGPLRDINLIEPMVRVIEDSPNNKIFIILHSYGSHFEYRKRYPSEMSHFTPDANSGANPLNRDQLLNAYDNTIRYTDMLLDSIIGRLDALNVPAAMLYVSDHGEDIFDDDRERFLHASPTPTYWQLHVPMVAWLSDEFIAAHPSIDSALRANEEKNIASTTSLFHTILDITGVHSPYFDAKQSIASPSFTEPKRYYLNDYNEAVDLRRSGLREPDFIQLNRHHLAY